MSPRDEAAIANAMLLGELVQSGDTIPIRYYAFKTADYYGPFERTLEAAAWMFLAHFGYGIESNGTEIVRLRTLMEQVV